MYLRFNKIFISGFQSINTCEISLNNQGIVSVLGINNYDDYTNSNGSGKSSIFEAIYWTLFGKTTKGVLKPVNRYLDIGCKTILNFNIDSDTYEVTRSINDKECGTTLKIIQNNQDISGRNKSDSDKILQNQILKEFTSDIFLSIVFLSQGFNNRLSVLSPAGRKDRLETLAQISIKISQFKEELSVVKSRYDKEILKYTESISEDVGEKNSCEKELYRLSQIIIEAKATDKPDINLDNTQAKIEQIKNSLNILQESLDSKNKKKNDLALELSQLSIQKTNLKMNLTDYQSKLSKTTSKCCPTCGQKLGSDTYQKLAESYDKLIQECVSNISIINDKLKDCYDEQNTIKSDIDLINTKISKMKDKVSQLNSLIIKYLKVKDTTDEEKHVEELKSQIHNFDVSIDNNKKEKSEFMNLKQVTEHCEGLVSKQFRNYLLEDVINFINSRLLVYSKLLYSNEDDIIYLKSDSSKLDIYLGDAIYDTLSGGEGRKVDLALSLAQRDLALNLSGSSSNLLILDEIMDNLDTKAIDSVMNMFISVADDIDSMFIISHMQLANIPFDSTLLINKGEDKISSIVSQL